MTSCKVERRVLSKRMPTGGRLAVSAFVLFAMIVSALAQGAPEATPQPTAAPDKEVVVDPEARDGEIESRLARIFAASNWFRAVSVEVREGIVFLDGETETNDRREWVGQLARKTQDVVAVVNRPVPIFAASPSILFDTRRHGPNPSCSTRTL